MTEHTEMRCLIDARIQQMKVVYMGEHGKGPRTPYIEITALIYPKAWREKNIKDDPVCVPTVTFQAPYHIFGDKLEAILNEVIGYAWEKMKTEKGVKP